MFNKDKKMAPAVVGFYQAVGAALYVSLVATLISYLGGDGKDPDGLLGMMLPLLLLVLSAAICGTLIFGYPVYLTMSNKVKDALAVLGYTFLYILFFIIILVFIFRI